MRVVVYMLCGAILGFLAGSIFFVSILLLTIWSSSDNNGAGILFFIGPIVAGPLGAAFGMNQAVSLLTKRRRDSQPSFSPTDDSPREASVADFRLDRMHESFSEWISRYQQSLRIRLCTIGILALLFVICVLSRDPGIVMIGALGGELVLLPFVLMLIRFIFLARKEFFDSRAEWTDGEIEQWGPLPLTLKPWFGLQIM